MKQLFLWLTIGWMCFIFYQGSRQLDDSYSQSDVIVDQVMEMIETIQETFKEKSESTETNQMATPTPEHQVHEAALAKKISPTSFVKVPTFLNMDCWLRC